MPVGGARFRRKKTAISGNTGICIATLDSRKLLGFQANSQVNLNSCRPFLFAPVRNRTGQIFERDCGRWVTDSLVTDNSFQVGATTPLSERHRDLAVFTRWLIVSTHHSRQGPEELSPSCKSDRRSLWNVDSVGLRNSHGCILVGNSDLVCQIRNVNVE